MSVDSVPSWMKKDAKLPCVYAGLFGIPWGSVVRPESRVGVALQLGAWPLMVLLERGGMESA